MSFDVNVLSSKPVIKAAASMQNDGGGGNLGYMSQGRRENEEKREEINIFAQKPEIDTFSLSSRVEAQETEFSLKDFVNEIIESIKRIVRGK